MKSKINVTSPFLPSLDEYTKILSKAWENKWLTNSGELHKEFEKKITNFLDVPYLSLFNNATIALLVAQEALNFKNEIITSPFSFIATAHSIKWNESSPVFVDTDEKIGNIDPYYAEKAINENTGGILAVHSMAFLAV